MGWACVLATIRDGQQRMRVIGLRGVQGGRAGSAVRGFGNAAWLLGARHSPGLATMCGSRASGVVPGGRACLFMHQGL
jgi:hypothetical protein